MRDLQSPGLKTPDGRVQSLSMVSDGKDLVNLSEKCGATHETQTRDKTAPQGETRTERGALGENSEAMACCRVRRGMEQG